ncbi:MAG TPA: MazG family protein [Acidimicrobiales bacterium]|nr:MazG family protein [Acidimicrobiales bacterium]
MTRPTVVVAGLGPAGPEMTTPQARQAFESCPTRFLRTRQHPAAEDFGQAASFDHLYRSLASFEDVYAAMVEELVAAARRHGRVAYAVPGSPLVAERSVERLLADQRVELEVVPGMSFLDLAWCRLGVDPMAAGACLVDGQDFARQAAGRRGPLLVGQCWSRQVLSELKVAVDVPADTKVVVLRHLGLADEWVGELAWSELDRQVDPDPLTSLYVPELPSAPGAEVVALDELVRTLRQRCPWDRAQDHASVLPHLLEEAYEVVDAVEALDGTPNAYAHLEEELGDLLFQVCFHARLAAEAGRFCLADVARGVHDKLVGRHPHVFGSARADTPEAVMGRWEQIKRAEKRRTSLLDGIPRALPALALARKLQAKAAAAGLGPELPPQPGPSGPHELGRALFDLVAEAGRRGLDPEAALRSAVRAFARRLARAEELAGERGTDLAGLGPEERAEVWALAAGGTGSSPES